MEQKPKLSLVPPQPLILDELGSRAWSDGSGLYVTSAGITLVEAREKYFVNRPTLHLVEADTQAP